MTARALLTHARLGAAAVEAGRGAGGGRLPGSGLAGAHWLKLRLAGHAGRRAAVAETVPLCRNAAAVLELVVLFVMVAVAGVAVGCRSNRGNSHGVISYSAAVFVVVLVVAAAVAGMMAAVVVVEFALVVPLLLLVFIQVLSIVVLLLLMVVAVLTVIMLVLGRLARVLRVFLSTVGLSHCVGGGGGAGGPQRTLGLPRSHFGLSSTP